jgi:fructose-bisphosphate aldolase class II
MKKLREVLQQAEADGVAVGHFNVGDFTLLKAVFGAARELNVPVVVGASEGERAFLGTRQIAALVKSLREEFDFPLFLNADHTHSLPSATEAARAGFDAVVFDLSALAFKDNIKQTKEAVQALKSIRLGDCRWRFASGHRGRNQHDPYQHRAARGLETRAGRGPRQGQGPGCSV